MEDAMLMSQPVIAGGPSSSGCYYSGNGSGEEANYAIKMEFLRERFSILEDTNNTIRNRIIKISKEINQIKKEKSAITAVLINYGDNPFKGHITMDGNTNTPDADWCPEKELVMTNHNLDGTPKKRSRPSGKSKSKAAKAKAKLDEAEKKEEEEKTLSKIVDIITSVKSETARKTAKIEQEMKDRVASMTKNVATSVQSVVDRAAMPPPSRVPPPRNRARVRNAHTAAQLAAHAAARANDSSTMIRAVHSSRPIPYRVYRSPLKNEIEVQAEQHVEGQFGGIRFSYTPHDSKDLFIPAQEQIDQLTAMSSSAFQDPLDLQPMESYQETFSLDTMLYPEQHLFDLSHL